MATASTSKYRYTTEIAAMCIVFSGAKDASEEVVQFIEDTVRTQIGDLVVRARSFAQRRNARLGVEDLIFSIRHDRAKVNRLRIYLSWKDLRKKAKEQEGAEEGPDVETLEEPATEKSSRSHKKRVKISWGISNIFSEHVKEDSDEEDEDEIAAYEDSKQRLKEADDLTRLMSREQYQHYSECRQASFTYRKAKRFREFVGSAAYIEGNVNDEVLDVLGFLSYEMVRRLCEGAMTSKRVTAISLAKQALEATREAKRKEISEGENVVEEGKDGEDVAMENSDVVAGSSKEKSTAPTSKKLKQSLSSTSVTRVVPTPTPRHQLVEPTSLFSLPSTKPPSGPSTPRAPGSAIPSTLTTEGGVVVGGGKGLTLGEMLKGISANSDGARVSIRSGMKNWRSGVRRSRN